MTPPETTLPLFGEPPVVALGEQAFVLRGFALDHAAALLQLIARIDREAPFRHMQTRGGLTMSVALTNCGQLGWTSDRHGYRYTERDPLTGLPWPAMPGALRRLGHDAASEAGFDDFDPDACLINRYAPGTRLSLHQDRNERTFDAPIVSVSLGATATFQFGGRERTDPIERVALHHGDVAVWGGVDRLRFHGVSPLKAMAHPLTGPHRYNLTLRRAGGTG